MVKGLEEAVKETPRVGMRSHQINIRGFWGNNHTDGEEDEI